VSPIVAVVVVILTVIEDDLCVLLIRRSGEPFADYWALPGGLLPPDESLDRAAARKLLEETGVQDVYLEQLYTFGELSRGINTETQRAQRGSGDRGRGRGGRDAAMRGRTEPTTYNLQPTTSPRGIAVTYFALVQHEQVRLRESETWQPAWHNAHTLPALAFDNNRVVEYAIRRLRAKLDYTNVAYSLLPRTFTLSELQQVYEAILDRPLDKRNFRRRMLSLGIIKAAGGTRMEGAHRPAGLYAFVKREPVVV
jgi:8-oxo-dGTP diphosphatase